ncbi:MAG TPA: choice-of-anchor Q domain-containing protein, partial [Solirubrobacterales bacterium]|nr:choice-of-anchor Q domain-containing protein [Solirubrobacterales bacterium]
ALAAAALALVLAAGASAKTFEVTKRADPAPDGCKKRDCSLREAVIAANARPGRDVIELSNRRRPYRLARGNTLGGEDGALEGDLDVTNAPVVIRHPGKGRATIDARGIDRAFDVFAGAPTTFRKLVIRGGADPSSEGGNGGGIRSDSNLRLVRTAIVGNASTACGGGIHTRSGAGLRLIRSRVSANRAASDGGGLSHSCFGGSGPLTVRASAIVGNVGDSDNDGSGRGGGMYFQTSDGVRSSISTSTIAGNRAGDEGGGMYTDLGRLTISRSTVSRNRTRDAGGGISVDGTDPLLLVNSTVANNRSDSVGGGVHADGSSVVVANAATVARNLGNADGLLSEPGGGLFFEDAEGFVARNSLIATNRIGNLGGGAPIANDCSGTTAFESAGNNLLSTRFLCDGFDRPTDRVRENPRLGRLKRNGGPTETIALRRRSPAINNASRASAPKRDQRGRKRGRKRDIGAFERNVGR